MEARYFSHPSEFRAWLMDHHKTEKELLVGFYKKGSGIPSIDWPQSVDQALSFGWIDGIRRSVDAQRYTIRFTPRKKNSHWSAVNLKRIQELDAEGLLMEAGRKIWLERNLKNQNRYSFEQENQGLSTAYEAIFQQHPVAWENFNRMAPSYRKPAIWYVMSAKQEVTQLKRLGILIDNSAQNLRIPSLRPLKSK